MKNVVTAALTALALTALANPAFADDHMKAQMSNVKMNTLKMVHSCPKEKYWVKGYTKKDGHKVAGYCRKR